MKTKSQTIIIALLILSFLSAIYFSHLALAATPDEVIQSQIGINPDNIPSDPSEITSKYLKQEWSKLIATWPIIGPIHSYLLVHPIVFQVLFNYQYEISLTLFLIIILWIYFTILGGSLIDTTGLVKKGWQSLLFGVAIALILAHTNIIKNIVLFTLGIIFKQDQWWIRTLLWLLAMVVFWVIAIIANKTDEWQRKQKKAQKDAEVAQAAKEGQAAARGLEKGQKMAEDTGLNQKANIWRRMMGYQ